MTRTRHPIILLLILTVGILHATAASAAPGPMLYGTDFEGMNDNFIGLLRQKGIRVKGGRLEFSDKKTEVVFGGDLIDRGDHSIRLIRLLTDLKQRHPDRVTLIWGNRDVKSLALPKNEHDLKVRYSRDFADWIVDRYVTHKTGMTAARRRALWKRHNTLANRVEFWLDSHSARGGFGHHQSELGILEQHRRELEAIEGRHVSRTWAARDYIRRILPGGEIFNYLKLGQVMAIKGSTLFVHGGVTNENLYYVPGESKPARGVRSWVKKSNAWCEAQLKLYEKAARTGKRGSLPQTLVEYGDARWDPKAWNLDGVHQGVVLANSKSPIYPYRNKEDDNFRLPTKRVIRALKRAGVNTVVVGHSPVGNTALPLRDPKLGFTLVMGDTSFGSQGQFVSMRVSPRGSVRIRGRNAAGDPVRANLSSRLKTLVGLSTNDGFTVVGKTGRKYALSKYYNGFLIDEKVLSWRQLKKLKPSAPHLKVDQERNRQVQVLRSNMARRHLKELQLDELPRLLGDRRVFVESGASKYGQFPVPEAEMKQSIAAFYDRFSAKKIAIFTGGTDNGVEKLVHEYAKKRGIPVIGFINEGAVPGELRSVRRFVISGRAHQWLDPLKAAMSVAKSVNGEVVFRGGGQTVGKGIKAARTMRVKYHLMSGSGGASAEWARSDPQHAFRSIPHLSDWRGARAPRPSIRR
jgi:hypothetical protein